MYTRCINCWSRPPPSRSAGRGWRARWRCWRRRRWRRRRRAARRAGRRRRRAAARRARAALARAAQHGVVLPRALQLQPLCNRRGGERGREAGGGGRGRGPTLTQQVRLGAGQQLVQHVEVALALQRAARAVLRTE